MMRRSIAKKKNYAESSNSETSQDDDDFEPARKRTRNTTKKLPSGKPKRSRNVNDDDDDDDDDRNKDSVHDAKGNDLEKFGMVSRPNLSESESSEDDMNIADVKKALVAEKKGSKGVKVKSFEVKCRNLKFDSGDVGINKIEKGKEVEHNKDRKDKTVQNEQEDKTKRRLSKIIKEKKDRQIKENNLSGDKNAVNSNTEEVEKRPSLRGKRPGKVLLMGVNIKDDNNPRNTLASHSKNTAISKNNQSDKRLPSKKQKDEKDTLKEEKNKLMADSKNNVDSIHEEIKMKTSSRAAKQQKAPAREKKRDVSKPLVNTEQEVSTKPKMSVKSKRKNVDNVVKENKKKPIVDCLDFDDFMNCEPGPSHRKAKTFSSEDDDDDDSENDWEDVHEADISKSLHESPKKKAKVEADFKDIAINLKVKSIHKSKSEKNKELFVKYMERMMRKFQQDLQNNKHKDHLICLVARTIYLNKQSNNPWLQATCLSLVPLSITKISKNKWDIPQLRKLLNWFQTGIPDTETLLAVCSEDAILLRNIKRIQVLVALLRAVGLLTRIIISLQPMSPKVESLFRFGKKAENPAKSLAQKTKTTVENKSEIKSPAKGKKLDSVTSPYFKGREERPGKESEKSEKKEKTKVKKGILESKSRKGNIKQLESQSKHIGSSARIRKLGAVNYADSGNESGEEDGDESTNDRARSGSDSDPSRSLSNKLSEKARHSESPAKRSKSSKSLTRPYEKKLIEAIDDDDDFEQTSKPSTSRQRNKVSLKPVKVVSSDSETEGPKSNRNKQMTGKKTVKLGCDIWAEVYLTSMKKWVCIELSGNTIDEPFKCEKMATQPLQYVIGIDNDNAIKDVTCRYAEKFMTQTRKLRIDREWWAETLKPFETKKKKIEELEDTELHMELLKRPFPKTKAEFKGHPLYVLEGDLLKFEAIYPESAAILGYVGEKSSKQAIYSRECVHILHTRENWLKEARVVKQGEVAYKIVRGRPKRNTPIHERDKVKIDLFGLWQTEVYKPPPIVNGKVPRNEYGNVELFKPCMLPPVQGIHKVAKKLNIDAAPAMMGWDFHSGCAHPIIEGVIVAQEYEEKLLDAWQKEEDEIARKKHKKSLQKIYDRWKLLVKGLLVRERIKRKYDFKEYDEGDPNSTRKGKEEDDSIAADDVSVSWPLNKMEGKTSLNEKGHHHIFPKSGHKQDKITGEWTKSCSCGLTLPFGKL